MENLLYNQGYQHIVEEIVLNLELESLIQTSLVNRSLHYLICDDQKILFKICSRKKLLDEKWLEFVKKPKSNEVKKSFLAFFKHLLMLDKIQNDKYYKDIAKLTHQTYRMFFEKGRYSYFVLKLNFRNFQAFQKPNETVYKMFWYHKNKKYNINHGNELDLVMFLNDKTLIEFIGDTFPHIEKNDLFTTAVLRYQYESIWNDRSDKIMARIFATLIENPNPTFDNGTTLLHVGAKRGNKTLVKTLVQFCETCNLYDDFGKTPMMYTFEENQTEIRELLDPSYRKSYIFDLIYHYYLMYLMAKNYFINKWNLIPTSNHVKEASKFK